MSDFERKLFALLLEMGERLIEELERNTRMPTKVTLVIKFVDGNKSLVLDNELFSLSMSSISSRWEEEWNDSSIPQNWGDGGQLRITKITITADF